VPENAENRQALEGMNITGVTGLTDAQKSTLKALGAIDITSTSKLGSLLRKNVKQTCFKRHRIYHEAVSYLYNSQ